MMEQTNPMGDSLRYDGGQAESRLSIAATSEAVSNTSASKTNVRDEGMTILSDGVSPVAE